MRSALDADKTQIGYKISFTRYFDKPTPLRTLAEIEADIRLLEKESEGLLDRILGAEWAPDDVDTTLLGHTSPD